MTTWATPRLPPAAHPEASEQPQVLELVRDLAVSLAEAGVSYCHWKSNEALDRSLRGDNDLDLLVSRASGPRFLQVLARLGFKHAVLPPAREVPAVSHYYGLDRSSGRLVHVHAHFRLVLGDDTTKNFWLPVEAAYLSSSSADDLLPVPAPEYELAVLVLRMVLKHATWDAQLQRRGALTASERRELDWLQARTDWPRVDAVVAQHLPFVMDAWPACRRALEPGRPAFARARAAAHLLRCLETCARRDRRTDLVLRVGRRVGWGLRSKVVRRPVRKRLAQGGAVVALVGGDGSGKSTAVAGLAGWLSGPLEVRRVHLGRPPKSWTTVMLNGGLALVRRTRPLVRGLAAPATAATEPGTTPSSASLLPHLLTARDRRLAYTRARRFAAGGGVVVCDRYPVTELPSMDSARAVACRDIAGMGRVASALVSWEARQYAAFTQPDVLAVLRVDPEVAVRRKPGEGADYVRRRGTEVWNARWPEGTAVIDAAQPAADVLADLRVAVWEGL